MTRRSLPVIVTAIALVLPFTLEGRMQAATGGATAVAVDAGQQTPRVRVGGDISAPKKLKHVEPVYPDDAKAAGVAGVVILEVLVNSKGLVSETRVIKSIDLLDAAATEAVRQWEYTPTLLNGEPCEVVMTVTINFHLKA